jgi:HEAT repeat protein
MSKAQKGGPGGVFKGGMKGKAGKGGRGPGAFGGSGNFGGRGRSLLHLDAAKEAVAAAGAGLEDPDPQVRALSLEVLRRSALALHDRFLDFPRFGLSAAGEKLNPRQQQQVEQVSRLIGEQQAQFLPVIRALCEQGATLRRALRTADPAVNRKAAAVLEILAGVRTRLLQWTGNLPKGWAAQLREDSLGPVLWFAVPDLATRLSHEDSDVRVACLRVLEALGTDSAPAAEALVKALKDQNPSVRDGAVRALGQIHPAALGEAVARKAALGLAACVADESAEVRSNAVLALRFYGPAAGPAAEHLARALEGKDARDQLLILETLEAVGARAKAAVPALGTALAAEDLQVRVAAARALARLGPDAAPATRALVGALDDANPTVRLAASEALLGMTPAGR